MSETFFTSDLHINHLPEFLWGPRGFSCIEEMNEAIVERWNNIVKEDDVVYNLGDMAMNDVVSAIPYLKRLNGVQIWILGNHDSLNKITAIKEACPNIWLIGDIHTAYASMIKHGKIQLYLSHYPTLTSNWNDKYFNQHVFSIHGHTHQKTNWLQPLNPFLYHVGMDSHNCTPVHIEEVISDIRNRWNEIGQLPTPAKPEDLYPYENI